MSRREGNNMSPALLASLLVHAGLFAFVIMAGVWFKKPPQPPGGVPITIVTQGPPEFINAPVADTPQEAQAEVIDPVPDEVVAEPDLPPTPTPKPVQPTPRPAAPAGKGKPAPPTNLDFDRLLKDVQTASPKRGKPPPATTQGTPQAAATIKVGSGKKLSGATKGYLLTLGEELGRRYRPPCNAEGASKVKVTVRFTVGPFGLVKNPETVEDWGKGKGSTDIAAYIAARRAVFAAKFDAFPPELYGEELIVPFDASVVCGKQ